MFDSLGTTLIFLAVIHSAFCLLPAKFQWKTLDWNWEGSTREKALADGSFVPEHNLPTGLARWRNKLFITVPRWKRGVPASLNYVLVDGAQGQPLQPYPTWLDAYIDAGACCAPTNSTVVSAFHVAVDRRDRLWVVDNGIAEMATEVKAISSPAILVFDLLSDKLIYKYVFNANLLKESSVLTSIVVDDTSPEDTFAYVTDMGSNAVLVFSLRENLAWRLDHPHFKFDPSAGAYHVGGVEFYWSDGVSSATLSAPDSEGHCTMYLHPTSSTKQFKISSRILRNKNATEKELMKAVEIVGDRGPDSQVTACDMDRSSNILFFTQLSKNGVGCWNTNKPFVNTNTPLIASDCNLLEFPSDIKVDDERNLWILSNRQSRFLYETMDFSQVNFRVLTAPADAMVQGSACAAPAPCEDPAVCPKTPCHAAIQTSETDSKPKKPGFFKRLTSGKWRKS